MKQGELYCIKTTGEVVVILNEDDGEGNVVVRRAKETRDGVEHVEEQFEAFELESAKDYLTRKAENYTANLELQKSVIGKRIKQLERELEKEEEAAPIDITKFNVN